jgi:Undecaprenyl-phosphate glucose phosphotransferase
MLKKNAQLFEGLMTATDLAVVSVAWGAAYWLRFVSDLIPVEKGIPPFVDYARVLLFIWVIWASIFRRFGLYRPMRGTSRLREAWLLLKANTFAVLVFLACTYLFREKSVPFSRLVFVIFFLFATLLTISSRALVRLFLGRMRREGLNLRYALVVGAGELAEKVCERLALHPEFGIDLLGCLSADGPPTQAFHQTEVSRTEVRGGALLAPQLSVPRLSIQPEATTSPSLKIIGCYQDLPALLERGGVDQVIIALPLSDHDLLEEVVSSIGDNIVDVKLVPDYHRFIKLGALVEELDGLPVMSLASTPLAGINRVMKRIFDLTVGLFFFLLALPVLLVAAALVKLTSPGPIFYSQERVGLDGQTFKIFKLRTMRVDAERAGARFAIQMDPRVTPVGKWLRRFSIDEIPQLVNVLRGQMSLVGPRPERPVFISEFRKKIPDYMLRHKVQAGMTGWAQVKGWRGNTSIEKRIEHDLFYIENWSLLFDMKIIIMTLTAIWVDENAY